MIRLLFVIPLCALASLQATAQSGCDGHISHMPRASYRIIAIEDSTYGVAVDEPNTPPLTVIGFQSLATAEH
jgi:hypothetical protein